MVSALFESTIGADFDDQSDVFTQCVCALLRVVLLTATFVLGQRTFQARSGQKVRSLPCITKGTPRTPSTRNRYPKKLRAPSDDEDDLSTSVGSSDSETDMLSSDNEDEVGSTTKISASDLLRLRPAAGPAPIGSLRAMPVAERVSVSRAQFEQRQWENLRGSAAPQQRPAPAKPSKAAPSKQPSKSDSKPAKKSLKPAPVKQVTPQPVDAATEAANAARMAALLEIICPEDNPAAVQKTSKSGAPPPCRRQQTATESLLPPGLTC